VFASQFAIVRRVPAHPTAQTAPQSYRSIFIMLLAMQGHKGICSAYIDPASVAGVSMGSEGNPMKQLVIVIAILLCSSFAQSATEPVARVNGIEIPRDAFNQQLERTRSRFKRAGRDISPQLETLLKEDLIRKLVDDELIQQKAKSERIIVAPEALEKKLTELKERFGTDKAFQAFLARTNQSEQDVKLDLSRNLLRDALFSKLMGWDEPTELDAKEYFEKNREKYKEQEQVQASHILLKVPQQATHAEKKTKLALAKKLAKKAKKKNADFAAMAREYSEGPTRSRGGDLGKFSRGRMVKTFEEAAFNATPGSVVGPIETQFGFHIIKVMEKFPARERSFDDVKDSVLRDIKAKRKPEVKKEFLTVLRKDATIEVFAHGIDLSK
jgi:peptidyl-prolyl cis-trans isomerase C